MSGKVDLQAVYERRFSPDVEFRRQMWEVLSHDFFQRYISPDSTVMEVAAGYCEFINSIRANRKIAIDLNPDTRENANPDVQVIINSSTDLAGVASQSVDVAFCSNFFEHLTKPEIVLTMREVRRVLKPGGRFLILQPNIRFCAKDYWMFFDHITPLDDRSLTEALETNGFKVVETITRFLPYTTKSRLPNSLFLLKMYLKIPLAWKFLGQQSFIVAEVS